MYVKVRCLYEVADGVIFLIGTTGGLLSCSTDFSRPEEIRFFIMFVMSVIPV